MIELARRPLVDLPKQEETPPQVFVATHANSLENIDPQATRIRLTRQEMFSLAVIKDIIDRFDNLEEVHVNPSHAGRLLGPSVRNELDGHGIKIVVGRMLNRKHYDSLRPNKRSFEEGKRLYAGIANDPGKLAVFRRLEARGFVEVEMARTYFEEDKKISVIAQELRIPPAKVQRRLAALMYLMGKPTRDKIVLQAVRGMIMRLQKYENEEKSAKERERFVVSGQYPPDTLWKSRHEMWQKLTQALARYPDIFVQIKESVPSWYEAMMVYYQVGEFRGDTRTLDQLARGRSGETARHKKLSGLRLLRRLLAQRGVSL